MGRGSGTDPSTKGFVLLLTLLVVVQLIFDGRVNSVSAGPSERESEPEFVESISRSTSLEGSKSKRMVRVPSNPLRRSPHVPRGDSKKEIKRGSEAREEDEEGKDHLGKRGGGKEGSFLQNLSKESSREEQDLRETEYQTEYEEFLKSIGKL
ncbi:hypothetical protein IE53DRAFT_382862 [Violaceomyces palustris]|uniref:Uncharacterized protein n=1 Tax=Violaceomyces palustris TaxID=1673888 RepID=A0ACD0NL09_9BASI|nr:hypothetical protein IE53DRAFT_382862 [Violaceomyces palustris]